jgi:putative heme-binding domain-containing protein
MVLIYLEAEGVVGKTLDLMAKAPAQEEQIHYAFALRNLKTGWTLAQRKQYFAWFNKAGAYRGGASFGGFVKNIKAEAMNTLTPAETEALAEVLKPAPPPEIAVPIPAGPGKTWTVADLAPAAESGLRGRDFANGKKMFSAGLCFMCHRFNDVGGAVGPDLSTVGNRFSARDVLESVIEPSKTISDQYGATEFHMTDGRVIIGRIANLSGGTYRVSTNMLDSQALTGVNAREVKLTKPSPVSMMPENLINAMNQDEVLDLLAYLLSGGNPEHDMFKD